MTKQEILEGLRKDMEKIWAYVGHVTCPPIDILENIIDLIFEDLQKTVGEEEKAIRFKIWKGAFCERVTGHYIDREGNVIALDLNPHLKISLKKPDIISEGTRKIMDAAPKAKFLP